MLRKSGYDLYFYKKEDGTQKIGFFVRDLNSLIPIDVKAKDGKPQTMVGLINNPQIQDINYGIKLAEKNIGFKDNIYTFPYFLTFLLKRYLREK